MVTRITWTADGVKIPAVTGQRNEGIVFVSLNFAAPEIDRGGLLEEAINEMALPVYRVKVDKFVSWCQSIDQDVYRLVLSTPAAELTQDAIIALYFHARRIQKHKEGFYFIRNLDLTLADGTLISDLPYDALVKNKKHTGTPVMGKKQGILNPGAVREALKEADAQDSDSARLAVEAAMREQSQLVEDACWSIVEPYLATRDYHKALLERPVPSFLSGQAIYDVLRFPDADSKLVDTHVTDDRLAAILHLIQDAGLFRYEDPAQLELIASRAGLLSRYVRAKGFSALVHKGAQIRSMWFPAFEIHTKKICSIQCLFMRWYIPRVVMTAMEMLVTLWTGWNSGTVLSITRRHITITEQHIVIDGVKSKTGHNFRLSVQKQVKPRFYQVLTALAAHDENTEDHWAFAEAKTRSVFATYPRTQGDEFAFQVSSSPLAKSHICGPMGIKDFTPKQLRDQAANLLYLSSLDPFKVKDFLGHANLAATHAYLNQHILRLLNEGNVNRFIDILSATITWATRGEYEVEARGMRATDINRKLLFPVGDAPSDIQSIADDWLDTKGDLEITIGIAEIEHLRYQIRYYKDNKDKLHSGNPKGFLLYHVPRILFAAALAECVRQHPVYGQLLSDNDQFAA